MGVPVIVKVTAFSLAVMGAYTYYSNSIPQIESQPPREFSLEAGTVTTAQLIRAGEEIYHTKGTCDVCHGIGQKGTRAPDLAGIGARAEKMRPGMSGTQYLIESLIDPSAFIVEGFPPIMPAVDRPPIALNRSEIWALTAFLQSLGGTVDVALDDIPATAGVAAAGPAAPAELKLPGDVEAGQVIYTGKGACGACHKAGEIPGTPLGPDLSQIARIQTPDYIMRKILDPKGMGTVSGYPPGVMPQTFGQTLTAQEFTDLMAFMLTLK